MSDSNKTKSITLLLTITTQITTTQVFQKKKFHETIGNQNTFTYYIL